MSFRLGPHEFDRVWYDADGDVLYMRSSSAGAEGETHATPEGHAVTFDENGEMFGVTIVSAKWLADREGKIVITFPERIETSADDLAPVLV